MPFCHLSGRSSPEQLTFSVISHPFFSFFTREALIFCYCPLSSTAFYIVVNSTHDFEPSHLRLLDTQRRERRKLHLKKAVGSGDFSSIRPPPAPAVQSKRQSVSLETRWKSSKNAHLLNKMVQNTHFWSP